YLAGQSKLEARAKELQAAQTPVEEKIKTLTEALAWETKRREAVERMAVDAFKRRRELEARLAKNQEAEKALQQEMAGADRGKQRGELEARLAQNQQAQAQLRQEIAESQKQLQAQQADYLAEQSRLEAGTEALAEQSGPRTGTDPQDAEVDRQTKGAGRRGALNAVRGFVEGKIGFLKHKPRESAEPQGVEGPQAQPHAPQESSGAEQTKFQVLSQELQTAHTEVLHRVKRLTETLAEETRRRTGAELQAGEVGQRRSDLEARLGQLRQELKASEGYLRAQH